MILLKKVLHYPLILGVLIDKKIDTHLEAQVDLGSAQNINSPRYLIVTHQTADRIQAPNKKENASIFNNLDVRNYYVYIDGARFSRDGVSFDYEANDYVDQYRDLKLYFCNMLEKNF